MTEKKRGSNTKGGAGEGTRPTIPSSHAHRPDVVRRAPRPRRPSAAGVNGVARPTRSAGAVGPRVRKSRTSQAPNPEASIASDDARRLAILIAAAALEKKALSVEVLDVAGKVDYADFLVLMTGRSDRQVQAIAHGIEDALREQGRRPQSVEGLPHAHWVLMDYIDVVVHVFQDDARGAYDLDGLWMDARRVALPGPQEER